MPSIALERGDIIVGVDTHKDAPVAVAIDGFEGTVSEPKVILANHHGYLERLISAQSLGDLHAFGVEGCRSYSLGLVWPGSRQISSAV